MGEPVDERRASSYERAHEQAGIATWSVVVATGAFRTNSAARSLIGWADPQRLPSADDVVAAVHPDDRERVRQHLHRLLRHGEEYELEHRVVRADGSVVHLRAVGCVDRDDAGRAVTAHGVTVDVTALRAATDRLERDHDRVRRVLAVMHEGYLLTRDGVILDVNDAVCRMTGFAREELVGAEPPYPYWPLGDVTGLVALRQRMQSAGGGEGEFPAVRKDGSTLRVSMTATALPDEDERPLWLVLLRDVTAQRDHERLLEARAASDPLTGVQNSRSFREDLRDAVLAMGDQPLSLALIDVDHFKEVNDRFGHAVGDQVLVTVVERLLAATADAGTLARVGGEEFALLMPGLDAAAGHRVLEVALAALRDPPVDVVGRITASAGVAQLLEGMTDDALYRLADTLLYEAKSRGRDQVR